MECRRLTLDGIPALLWGEPSDKLYLCIHGQGGCKEEAESISRIVGRGGWQVLSIDLPEHGERRCETDAFDPWHAVPELRQVMRYVRLRWNRIALLANSIGAWFSLLAFSEQPPERCLFISPVLDMERLIETMMGWAGVTREQLEQEGKISTDFGQTLSWDYRQYAREHPVAHWDCPTWILYAGQDTLTERVVAEAFARRFQAHLTVMENGEHWFHTPPQLRFRDQWIQMYYQ